MSKKVGTPLRYDVKIGQHLLKQITSIIKKADPNIKLTADCWVYKYGVDRWEFHGPNKFIWHGSASNAYEARYHGWCAYLKERHPDLAA